MGKSNRVSARPELDDAFQAGAPAREAVPARGADALLSAVSQAIELLGDAKESSVKALRGRQQKVHVLLWEARETYLKRAK